MRDLSFPVEEDLIISYDLTINKVKIYIKRFLDMVNPPDVIFANKDLTTIEVIQVIKQAGKKYLKICNHLERKGVRLGSMLADLTQLIP